MPNNSRFITWPPTRNWPARNRFTNCRAAQSLPKQKRPAEQRGVFVSKKLWCRGRLLLAQLGDNDKPSALILVIAGVNYGLAFVDRQGGLVDFLALANEFDFNLGTFKFLDFNDAVFAQFKPIA